jgi:tRNA(Ile)-lysidine synthase
MNAMPQKSISLQLNTTLLRPGQRIAVAVSGGADSTALLLALHQQRNELGLGLSAVHLHHGIRAAEADADRDFLVDLCNSLDIPLHLEEADIPASAAANAETLEEAARNARLALFRRLLEQNTADAVATAHTLDDQAETLLLKLIRGAWTEGLSAISPILYLGEGECLPVLRPILHLPRTQVEAFLHAHNQPWREDSTNASLEYTRNRVRHTLLPLLREFNPQIAATLAATAELAREEEIRWQAELARILPHLLLPGKPVRGGGRSVGTLPGEGSLSIEIERLRALDLPTRRRVLRSAAKTLGSTLSSADTLRLLRLAGLQPPTVPPDPTVASRTGAKLSLPSGLQAERSARELRLTRT